MVSPHTIAHAVRVEDHHAHMVQRRCPLHSSYDKQRREVGDGVERPHIANPRRVPVIKYQRIPVWRALHRMDMKAARRQKSHSATGQRFTATVHGIP
jgi:hypothetical protein